MYLVIRYLIVNISEVQKTLIYSYTGNHSLNRKKETQTIQLPLIADDYFDDFIYVYYCSEIVKSD